MQHAQSEFQLYLFGAPHLEYRHKPVAFDTRKAIALLAYLLLEGKPQSRDTIALLFWPDSDQASARSALRRTLSTLRSALSDDLVDFGRELISLHPGEKLWCDVVDFEKALANCRTHGHTENEPCSGCLSSLSAAVRLYEGDFMSGFSLRDSMGFDDWQFFKADNLRRDLAGALERLVNSFLDQGDFVTAIEHARRWLSLDSLNEAAHRTLILLYAQNNQRNAALRQYRECVRILDQELGVSPLEETTQLYEAVKENQLELAPVAEQTTSRPGSPPSPDKRPEQVERLHLVGRRAEWETLIHFYERTGENGLVAAISGEAGIGKTRLAEEFLAQQSARGAVTLTARCYPGEDSLAFAPVVDLLRQGVHQEGEKWRGINPRWLSEAAVILPDLADRYPELPAPLPSDSPGAQSRFYEGICQTLAAMVAGNPPGVIFIDNLEWADNATLDIIAYLIRRLKGRPIFLLLAWRKESLSAAGSVEQVVTDAVSQGNGLELPLPALTSKQAGELLDRTADPVQPFKPELKERLVAESGGLPLFLVEYAQALLQGEIRVEASAVSLPVPTGLRGMLQTRLRVLSGEAAQILQAAAVIGRAFDSLLLQLTSGRTEEEVIQAVEELAARGLIREILVQTVHNQVAAHYDFKHDQVRVLVLEECSLIRRRLLHRRAAEALVEMSRSAPLQPPLEQVASHYEKAGMLQEAAAWHFKAGQKARSTHANLDALSHFQAALALGYPQRVQTLVELGDLFTLTGNYPQAVQQYESAAAINDAELLPFIEQKLGQIYLRRGQWEQAACHFEAAIEDISGVTATVQEGFEARVRADWSQACHRAGKMAMASELAQDALAMAEKSSEPLALAQAHNLLGSLARANQNPEQAQAHLLESLNWAKKLENPPALVAVLNNLALAHADQGNHRQAIATLQTALNECQSLGDRHLEAALRNNLADQLRADGDDDAAMQQLKQAVAIFAEIGGQMEDWEPEIWKLSQW